MWKKPNLKKKKKNPTNAKKTQLREKTIIKKDEAHVFLYNFSFIYNPK
jgi:hypothetical protein